MSMAGERQTRLWVPVDLFDPNRLTILIDQPSFVRLGMPWIASHRRFAIPAPG